MVREDSVHVIGAESDERISPTNFHDSERQQKYCSGIFAAQYFNSMLNFPDCPTDFIGFTAQRAPINISDFFCGFKMSRTGSMKEPVETPVLTEVEKLGRASTSEHELHPDRPYGVSHGSSPSASPERSAGETSEEGNLIEHDQAEPSNPDPFEVDSMIYKDWLNSVSIPPPAK
ncbi:hypothetical protein PSTT_10828 [Puccinia striiformis]|uniref:Uncharacterized protein n=1 Tax=Puccinia striiformis TaxID=27350 RepID=A0A2S4V2M5_9BASI|nr:hypothetical protein PSTT_10828 [Puccinia striiformis]